LDPNELKKKCLDYRNTFRRYYIFFL